MILIYMADANKPLARKSQADAATPCIFPRLLPCYQKIDRPGASHVQRTPLRRIVALLLAMPPTCVWAQGPSTAVRTVDTMNKLRGRHPSTRADHAKGVVGEVAVPSSLPSSGRLPVR